MNLVGEEDRIVLGDDLAEGTYVVRAPGVASRVLRIAQQHGSRAAAQCVTSPVERQAVVH